MTPTTEIIGAQQVHEALKKLAERIATGKTQVLVGVPEGSKTYEEGGPNIATIAAVNEFGSADGKIPARPFLRPAIADNADKFNKLAEKKMPDVLSGKIDLGQLLSQMGQLAAGLVQKKITDGPFVANAAYTIAKKRSSKPLIDTGALRQSITYVVVNNDNDVSEGIS